MNSDLDVGGGIRDGCGTFFCTDAEISGKHFNDGSRLIVITFYLNPLSYLLYPELI